MSQRRRKTKPGPPAYESLERRRLLAGDLFGTSGDDMIRIEVGSESIVATINGAESQCPLEDLFIDALDGNDSIVIVDGAGNDRAELRNGSVLVEGDVRIEAINVESSDVNSGGGANTAYLFDTPGVETLYADAGSTLLRGTDFDLRAAGYLNVIISSQSAIDTAYISDSIADDTFIGSETNSTMEYGNGATVSASNFFSMFVSSNVGGSDRAVLTGSDADDVVLVTERFSRIANGAFRIRASGFEVVLANESEGYDQATFISTEGNETFYGSPELGHMEFRHQAVGNVVGFERVSVVQNNFFAGFNGRDRAYIAAGDGVDQMFAHENATILLGEGYEFYLNSIRSVHIDGNGGDDTLQLIDVTGDSSVQIQDGRPLRMFTRLVRYNIFAEDFENTAISALESGLNNLRIFAAESVPNQFYGQPGSSRFVSEILNVQVSNFAYVFVNGGSHEDSVAFITGTEQDEELTGRIGIVSLRRDEFRVAVANYPNTYVNGMGGNDVVTFVDRPDFAGTPSISNEEYRFRGTTGTYRSGNGQFLSMLNFSSFDLTLNDDSERAGEDVVYLFDSVNDDEIQGVSDVVRFINDDVRITINSMQTIHAVGRSGGINTWSVGDLSPNTTLFRVGDWIDAPPKDPTQD